MVSDGATEVWTFYELNDLGNVITDEGVAAPGLNNILNGSSGNDHIMSGGGSDHINATQGGNDLIESGTERDFVEAGNGNNVIMGGAAGDILISGNGNDFLYADTQVDVATAIAQGNAQTGTGLQGDWLTSTGGDDTLIGSNGNDVLMGGAGSDLLIGGAGDDDTVGDGGFIVHEFGWSVYSTSTARVFEAFPFGPPISGEWASAGGAADVIYAGNGNDHAWGGMGNDVIFGEGDNDILSGDEGNDYLDGGAEDDTIYGGEGDDIIVGGAGADILYGGAGSDIYMFNRGDGGDTVYDSKADQNIFRFGAGITSSDITLRLGSLMLDLGNGDEIHIDNFDRNDVFNSSSISGFEFDDGSALTTTDLLARGFDLDGTAGSDIIFGTNTTDRINGLGGGDTLIGGAGGDTYLFNLGPSTGSGQAGQDTILDIPEIAGNVIRFGTGISAGNTQFLQQGADLLIKYGTQGDAALIQNFAPNGVSSALVITQFQFADGSMGTYTTDGMGNANMEAYANGQLVGKFWQTLGGYGNDTYNADGSSSGASFYTNGTSSNYTNDGLGNTMETAYLDYAQLIKTADSWANADGSYGSDVFNSDGSSAGITHLADQSYTTYTNDGHGDIGTLIYNAQGDKTGENWVFANGNSRIVTDDGLGNVTSTIYYV